MSRSVTLRALALSSVLLLTQSSAWAAISMEQFLGDLTALPSYPVRVVTSDALSGYPTSPLPSSPDYLNGSISRNDGAGEVRIESKYPDTGAAWDEIYLTPNTNTPNNAWVYETFCIERGEGISYGTEYYATLDAAAWYGTNGSGPATSAPDSLSADTKLLYGLYATGRLDDVIGASTGNAYTYDSGYDGERVQNIFWHLEDVFSLTTTEANWLDAVQDWRAANSGLAQTLEGNVGVVNLWKIPVEGLPYPSAYKSVQSFLIYVPSEESELVPEPASLAAWLGFAGLGLIARRRQLRGKRSVR